MDEKYTLSDGHNLPNVLSKWWPIVKKDLQTIFGFANKHITGEEDRHKAEDVDYGEGTVKDGLDAADAAIAKIQEEYLQPVPTPTYEDGIDDLKGTFDENGDGEYVFYVVVNNSEELKYEDFIPYLLLVSSTWNDYYSRYDTCQLKIQDGKIYTRYYTNLTPVKIGWTEWSCDLETAEGKIEALETQIVQKQDKDTIVTEAADNTLVLEENQDARLGETSSLVLSMPESIGDWYRSTFSFQSGESATSLVYGYTPLDWKGDDVTSDGRFVPEPFSTYEVDVKNLGINGIRARVDKIAGYSSVDVEGTVLSLPSSAGKALRDYKIYGNSVQDGEPSIETPAILQSVGDYNETTGKYDVTVGVGGANLLDWESNTEYAGVSAIEFDGKQCIKWLNDANAENQRFQQGSFKENTQYTFQLNLYFVNGGYVLCVYTDGSQDYINITSYTDNEWNHKHFVSAAGKTVSHWQGTHNGGDPIYLDVETSQIIEGVYTAETIPPCIPYREPVITTISLPGCIAGSYLYHFRRCLVEEQQLYQGCH